MIAIVLGTKAELIKMFPVMKELERQNKEYCFIHTGQHDISDLCKQFNLRKPDIVLYSPPKLSSRFMVKTHKAVFWGLSLIPKIRKTLNKIKPDYVLYHGDTLTTAAASIASSSLLGSKKWKNCHLESGLRSGKILEPFPEEISRRIADRFSDILFAVSKGTESFLKKRYPTKRIINTGNTIIDSIYEALKLKSRVKIPEKEYCLVNTHRHENIKSKERMKKIVSIIESVGINVIWPLHDNTKKKLREYGLLDRIEKNNKIATTPLVSYVDFIHLLKNCKYIITDGGSIQEESLELKKPCILIRNYTERKEGLKTGINFLTSLDINYTKKLIRLLEGNRIEITTFNNPYGKKGVSKKILGF